MRNLTKGPGFCVHKCVQPAVVCVSQSSEACKI